MSVAEPQGEGPVHEGSKFLTKHSGLGNEITLAEFHRTRPVVVAGTSNNMDIDTTYVFTEADGGTRSVVTTDLRPKGLTAVLSPLLRLFMRRELAKKYATFQQACESQSDDSSG